MPPQNPTYTQIDSRNFYLSTTNSVQYNVDDILAQNANLQNQIDANNVMLAAAAAVGVNIAPTS